MHKEIRFPGRMIVTQTIFRKDGFTSMITNFDQNQSILHILFAYVDSLTIEAFRLLQVVHPSVEKLYSNVFLENRISNQFFTQIESFLHQYPSFRASCGLSFVPHISTFSRRHLVS